MNSKKYSLGINDLIKGLIMTILSGVLATAYQLLIEVGLDWTADDFKEVLIIALTAGISYLLKNYFTDGQQSAGLTELKKRNRKKAVNDEDED